MTHSNKPKPFVGDIPSVAVWTSLSPTVPDITNDKAGKEGLIAPNVIPIDAGKRGKVVEEAPFTAFAVTNADFIAAIFSDLPERAEPIIFAKAGDPQAGGWSPQGAAAVDRVCRPDLNTYVNCASVYPGEGGQIAAKLNCAAAYHTLVLDDVGTKVDRALLCNVQPTWDLETSPGNFQVGFKLSPPMQDAAQVKHLQQQLSAAGLTDPGALGMMRWVRLPQGINGKPKHAREGKPFNCVLHGWSPDTTYSASALLAALGVEERVAKEGGRASVRSVARTMPLTGINREVYLPAAEENPVLSAFKAAGLYKREISAGKHDVTCPWCEDHTDGLDTGAAYYEPSEDYPSGGFRCQHSHGDQYRIGQVLSHFSLSPREARNRPVIRILPGGVTDQVRAAEMVLSQQGNIYQTGGMLVRVIHNDMTMDQHIQPLGDADLTMLLGRGCDWERGKENESWTQCDAPPRVITTLLKKGEYEFLPVLHGLVRQPSYRKVDGTLLTQPGYDPISKRLAVFDASAFPAIGHTREDAGNALTMLRGLLSEFRFAEAADEAAALCAMLTAVARPSLDVAPAIHVKAPSPGSGKSYLCDVIGRFTGGGQPFRMSYPVRNEEATKAIMAAFLSAPACIEYDDMSTDWFPHGAINRMLTSPTIADRILGQSKTVTVSTNALILGSGNNVGPIGDLCRRVLTININARTEMPATIEYKGNPVAMLKAARGKFVMAGLTIIEAWKAAGSPHASVPSIASYGDWADLCRQPLIWLGLPDPAGGLLVQMQNDPDAEHWGRVLSAWHRKFAEKPTTVRSLLDSNDDALIEAIHELPVLEGGRINNHKLGQQCKRNADRIVGGFMLQRAPCSERTAWRVTKVEKGITSLPLSEPESDAKPLF